MKENKYDNEIFFEKYSEMNRSVNGLEGAGEWSELRRLLPDFKDKRVLDLGCGYGWHCLYAAENGAKYVLGTDISEKMLLVANEKNNHDRIEYKCVAMEDLELKDETFDVVVSSLAFHYIKDFEHIVKNINKCLVSGGDFIFSAEHPIFTAHGKQDWYYDENGKILHFPLDNYYYEGERNALFLGERITKYHRTITTYLDTLLSSGFELKHIIEPQPPEEMMNIPGMKDEMRRPMMLLISARKI